MALNECSVLLSVECPLWKLRLCNRLRIRIPSRLQWRVSARGSGWGGGSGKRVRGEGHDQKVWQSCRNPGLRNGVTA